MAQPVPTTTNPLRDVYDALWALLRSKLDFNLLFGEATGHRQISVNDTAYWASDNDVDHASHGAHPRIRIVSREIDPNTECDSCGSLVTLVLEIQIWTAAQQQGLILDCVWAILRAMLNWRQYVQQVVAWNGKGCNIDVDSKRVELTKPQIDTSEGSADKRDARGFDQWIAVWRTEATFTFTSTDMLLI